MMFGSEAATMLLALASAAAFGAGDFSGGLATRRSEVYRVIITSQLVGLVLIVGLALAFQEHIPPARDLLWGAAAGVLGSGGLVLLYRALAEGRMGLAAPASAVVAAAIPVVVGILRQGLPQPLTLAGFALALVAVWLVARSGTARFNMRELVLPMLAGVFFGAFFVSIDNANDVATFWPLVAARCASLSLLVVLALTAGNGLLTDRATLPITLLAGLLDAAGNLLFALAAQAGRLDVAAVLVSLYPASTILLAWGLLKEPISRVQTVGIVLALIAIALIAA